MSLRPGRIFSRSRSRGPCPHGWRLLGLPAGRNHPATLRAFASVVCGRKMEVSSIVVQPGCEAVHTTYQSREANPAIPAGKTVCFFSHPRCRM